MPKAEKKKINKREAFERYQVINDRIGEIADACERENRKRTEIENKEYEELLREREMLEMRVNESKGAFAEYTSNPQAEAMKIIRENMAQKIPTEIKLTRESVTMADVVAGGIVPVQIQDIVKPLTEGIILSKLGITIPTGLAGDYVWPTYEAVEATVQNEGAALADTKIEMSKLIAKPERIGIAIPVTRQAILQSDNIIETIVKEVIPLSVAMLINKIMLGTTAVNNASSLKGPFVDLKASPFNMSAVPTFQEYAQLKAEVLKNGVDGQNLCFVMTKAQKAIAETTPIDTGSGRMICENDHICGIPVFTSQYIGETFIGLGDWRYQPVGMFGDMSFVIDPYSKARQDSVDFVFNAQFGTVTLQKKAFKVGKVGGKA